MRRTRKRGGNRPLPLQYFGDAAPVSAAAGSARLHISGNMVRPAIGGNRKTQKGGFVPSVMGNFVAAASKYITPLALFAAYKLMKHPTKKRKQRKQSKQSKQRK